MSDSRKGKRDAGVIEISVGVDVDVQAAFQSVCSDLHDVLGDSGIVMEPAPGGILRKEGEEVGRMVEWIPNERLLLQWVPVEWKPDAAYEMAIRFQSSEPGTTITATIRGLGSMVGDNGHELTGWITSQLLGPLAAATTPERIGDWLTDRLARRPSGPGARNTYRDPTYHRPNFLAILDELDLTKDDYLLEIGCGGGAFLHDAADSGTRGGHRS